MTTGNPTTGYSGDVFTLTNVVMTPAVPAVNQEVKITGKTKLFGIPFLGLVWITCDITYPKKDLDLFNPIGRYETMGFGSNFTLDIKKGFDRQGSFKTEILCYLGPTVKESTNVLGVGPGKIITLPPFPNVAAWPVFTFMVSGVLTNDFTVAAPACPRQIEAGASINVVVPITNNTATDQTVTVTMQDKQQNSFIGIKWNGQLVDTLTASLTVPAGETRYASWTYTETTDLGSRDLIVKVTAANGAVVGSGEFDGIYSVVAPPPVSLKISPSTIKVGDLLYFVLTGLTPNEIVKLTNQGNPTVLYSFTTDETGSYTGAFSYIGSPGSYLLVATDSSGKTTSASYTVQPSSSQYVVTINPDTIAYGGTVHFTISGFPANYPVSFAVVTAEYPTPGNSVITVTTDANGNGSGFFGIADPAGTYYLVDVNGFGTEAVFTITGGPPTAPTLQLTNNNVVQGGTITFEVWNFTPLSYVTVSEPNGNSVTLLMNEVGNNSGTLTNTEPTGTYTLTAKDNAGIEATASLTVVGTATISFKVYLFNSLQLGVTGTQLNLQPPDMHVVPIPQFYPVTSWTCKYYDPVTLAFVDAGSNPPTTGVSFSNVHPGGYLATTFTSNSGTTPEIDSSTFTAQDGDAWTFAPYDVVTGFGNDMQKETVVGTQVQLNITDDGSGRGFVLITNASTGVTLLTGSQVPQGTALKVEAFVYNPAVSMFSGWTGYAGSGDPIYPVANTDLNIVANFVAQIVPPPSGGPTFPAPGVPGDGDSWYWVQYSDGSIGWADSSDIYYSDPRPTILNGPYASGATG